MTLLKRHRLAHGWTLEQLAAKVGVKVSTVYTWEAGRSIPKPRFFPVLARVLGINAMELTKIVDPPVSAAPGQTVA